MLGATLRAEVAERKVGEVPDRPVEDIDAGGCTAV
jgi:hypothetical protein